jgi:proline iminopeptidase
MPILEQRLTVIYLEPAGTGDSGRLGSTVDYSFSRYEADLDRAREALGLERVYLLGHGHGALVALRYAIDRPEHLNGLVLYAASARVDGAFLRAALLGLRGSLKEPWFADATQALILEDAAASDEEFAALLMRELPLYVADFTHRSTEIVARAGVLRASLGPARATHHTFDLRPQLGRVSAPTLVISGARDYLFSPRFGDELAAGIRGSKRVTVENAGHFVHFEEERALAREIADFVEARERYRNCADGSC